ncbi:MAG: dUTP diphosphatase [Acidobacteria bacterium]|nr:dUTP diphosphatase [Acidobacteriota bacterium]
MTEPVWVHLSTLPHFEGLSLPQYQTAGSAGFDLAAAIPESWLIEPMQRLLVPTGLKMAIPLGYEGQVRPRSGLAIKHGITLINTPGTIDSDYRGEICVPLINLGTEPMTLIRGMRIAQMVIAPVKQVAFKCVLELQPSDRGEGGFGHTGLC